MIQRHIKVRGPAHPYHPDYVDYFKKRRCFAWRTYPLGKACQIAASRYHLRMKTHKHPMAELPRQRLILERLEPYEGKLSRTVLRGA